MPIRTCDLLEILACIQKLNNAGPLYCEYTRYGKDGKFVFRLELNIPLGVIRAESVQAREFCEYNRLTREFTLEYEGERHIEDDRPFPVSPPVLGLLSPIDLPIWGGEFSFYEPLETSAIAPSLIKVAFGRLQDAEAHGHIVMDTETGIPSEFEMNGVRYERTLLR
ncbi:hypothetical protein HMPREF3092_09500 [Brevibacterium sp. HMSC24B04]|nr:hypothetical protein HMPREF3092_09500 [Brevibacterium sp. HMSC24B04]